MTYFEYVKQQFNAYVYAVWGRTVAIWFLETFTRSRVDPLDIGSVVGWTFGIIFIAAFVRWWYHEVAQ
jgi:hypothetical protein